MTSAIFPNSQHIHSDLDHFWLSFKTYLQHTNRQEALEKWTEEEFESNVVKVLSEKFGDKLDDQPIRVLGVGSSEGYQESLQLKKIKTKFPQISATVIDPSTERISEYQERVHQNCSDFTGIEYEWHNQTFQEFVTSMEAGQKYHFITIVHAIYYAGEVEEAVRKLYELLEPGGMIFMVLFTSEYFPRKLAKTFPHLALEEQNPKTGELPKRNHLLHSGDIISVLKKYQMAYTQSSYTESADLTTCFTQEDTTEAKLLIDFVTVTIKFKESVSHEIYNQVMEILKCSTRVTTNNKGHDKVYLDNVCDILFISK
ncbi:histamine N-methyltransferase B-like [Amphiura filiformis]|uniref:histamine N-methyltransferase B-like n=1 Tax=Amphiura filiformis TaxID=82378 RepID=UPI003B20C4CD